MGSELWASNSVVTKESLTQIMRNYFRPEFLNRIDEIVVFHALDKGHIREIVKKQLEILRVFLDTKDIHLKFSESSINYLAEVGYDPDYGARPLKRAIQREIQDVLALKILSSEIRSGENIKVDYVDDHLNFNVTT
jgi:ATP-dependent Clp protease ATP-binding subunit ClpB